MIIPTRMELTRLKAKRKTAQRGHKLLKDKRDELMKSFLTAVRDLRTLRKEVEEELEAAYRAFDLAAAWMGRRELEQALLRPGEGLDLTVKTKNVMSVSVPEYGLSGAAETVPYGFAMTSAALDGAVEAMGKVLPRLVELAQMEKTAQLMAEEIEKTRRRVNALEYVVIPRTEETIRYISMKLEEQDRANVVRLIKVKSLILEQAREERRAETERALRAFAARDSDGVQT